MGKRKKTQPNQTKEVEKKKPVSPFVCVVKYFQQAGALKYWSGFLNKNKTFSSLYTLLLNPSNDVMPEIEKEFCKLAGGYFQYIYSGETGTKEEQERWNSLGSHLFHVEIEIDIDKTKENNKKEKKIQKK